MKNFGCICQDVKVPAESPKVIPAAQLKQGHTFQERKIMGAKYHLMNNDKDIISYYMGEGTRKQFLKSTPIGNILMM